MADQPANKVKRWAYPFQLIGNKEIEDPQVLLHALSMAEDGTYPIGANGLWHGGVHFDRNTGAVLAQDAGVRCIADGEVVAYRIDRTYPEIAYPDGKRALYSTGFVLIRHRLDLPPKPGVAPTLAPVRETPAAPELTFFSLYMHVLDWKHYEADAAVARPRFWGGPATEYLVGAKAKDKEPSIAAGETGLRIRDAGGGVIGLLARGRKVTLGSANPAKPGYYALAAILEGDSIPAGMQGGYVYKGELDSLAEPDSGALDSVFVLPQPKPIAAGTLIGHLGEYGRYVDATPLPPTPVRPLLHLEVFTADNIEAFIAQSRARAAELEPGQRTILVIEKGAKLCQAAASDKTIAAGSLVVPIEGNAAGEGPWVRVQPAKSIIVPKTSLRDYRTSGGPHGSYYYNGNRVRFSGRFFGVTDDVFVTNHPPSESKTYPRREIQVPDGPPVWIERAVQDSTQAKAAWTVFPLQGSASSAPVVASRRVISRRQLEKLPVLSKAKDEHGTAWWQVSVGAEGSRSSQGWVCEKNHPLARWQSPLDWPGFEVISESASPFDLFSRELNRIGVAANSADAKNLKIRADGVDGGSLLTTLREAIDAQGDRDGQISGKELKLSLRQPWLADHISKLIVKYESEWGGEMSKWDAVDSLMLDAADQWVAEKSRIKQLKWWDKGVSINRFPANNVVEHMSCIGVISNFLNQQFLFTLEIMQWLFPQVAEAKKNELTEIAAELNAHIDMFRLDTALRRAHFFAQVVQETGQRLSVEENFVYNKESLKSLFSYFSRHPAEADKHGYTEKLNVKSDGTAMTQVDFEAIANGAYGGRIGNGSYETGDGWKFRGRGLKQLTGRDNYKDFTEWHKDHQAEWPNDTFDFEIVPDKLVEPAFAARSAAYFWVANGLDVLADRGDSREDVDRITSVVNKNTDSYDARWNNFQKIFNKGIFK